MKKVVFVFYLLAGIIISGCASTTMQSYRAGGKETICTGRGDLLGHIAVLPEMAWRNDQKEPNIRQQMALEEIAQAFREIPCGSIAPPGGIRDVAKWSNRPESELLQTFSAEGVDTIILLRIEELTPRVYFTYSLPFLWASASEADFRIRALSVKSGEVLMDTRVKRSTGGPFHLRPAEWARVELYTALKKIMEPRR